MANSLEVKAMLDFQGLHLILKLLPLIVIVPVTWLFTKNLKLYFSKKKQFPASNYLKQYAKKTLLYGIALFIIMFFWASSFVKFYPQLKTKQTTTKRSFDTEIYESNKDEITIHLNKYSPDHKKAQDRWELQRNGSN